MQDRVPLYPGRVTLTPVSGQANTFDLVRADQPTQDGTPLNKASLLKDATAALYGLPNTAVPDDVLSKIKTLIDSANANANTKARIATGSYTGTRTYGASNPNSLTFDFVPKLWGIYAEEWLGGQNKIHFKPNFIKWGVGDINWEQQVEVPLTGNTRAYIHISYSENTVSWYNTASAANQFNSNSIYHYFAIG